MSGTAARCDEGSALPCLQEEGIRLELLASADNMEIVSALATKLQLSSPDRLRLTQHNAWAGGPGKQPYKWKEDTSLERVLPRAAGIPPVVYYEVTMLALPVAHGFTNVFRPQVRWSGTYRSSNEAINGLGHAELGGVLPSRCWTCHWNSWSR